MLRIIIKIFADIKKKEENLLEEGLMVVAILRLPHIF